MDQGIIETFKAYYTPYVYICAIQTIDADAFDNLKQYR
jgi:hypothetical protein